MFIEMKKRRYALKKRAESQEDTRARIVAATMALHEEIGPRATTISAIAERAGVQRLTVYRHFPDETAVFQACTSQWLELNPPPNAAQWSSMTDGRARCRAALLAMYTYYRRTARMWQAAHRDVADVPALQAPMSAFAQYIDELRDGLVATLAPTPQARDPVRATLGHALRFPAWQSLAQQKIGDEAIADLVIEWLAGIERRA
jgi:AcrR family transcriptional regulator